MKRLICFLLLISIAFTANMNNIDQMEATFTISGYITGGELELHVPYTTEMQTVDQTSSYEIFYDETGQYIKTTGGFSFSADIEVDSLGPQITTNPIFPLQTADQSEYTEATTHINSDNEAIIQLATQLVAEENNELEAITEIVEWVSENIHYDLSVLGEQKMDSVEVYESKRGVCGDYAVLSAALLRSVGIPTKYVEGFLLSSESIYQAHAWIEIYVPGSGWIPIDPTNEEMLIRANKIKVAEGKDPIDIADTIIYSGGTPEYNKDAVDITVKSTTEIGDYFDVDFSLEENAVGADSYVVARSEITNQKSQFLIPEFTLYHHSDLFIPDHLRFLILSPRATKTLSYAIFTPDVDQGYIYTVAFTGPGINEEQQFTLDPAILPKKQAIVDVFVNKYPRNRYVLIEVELTNLGNEDLYEVELIIDSPDHEAKTERTSLMEGEYKKVTFNFQISEETQDYFFELTLKADDFTITKSIPLTISEQQEEIEPPEQEEIDLEKAFILAAIIFILIFGIILLYPMFSKGKKPFSGRKELPKKRAEYKKHLKGRKIKHSLDFLSKSDKEEHNIDELFSKGKKYKTKRKSKKRR